MEHQYIKPRLWTHEPSVLLLSPQSKEVLLTLLNLGYQSCQEAQYSSQVPLYISQVHSFLSRFEHGVEVLQRELYDNYRVVWNPLYLDIPARRKDSNG